MPWNSYKIAAAARDLLKDYFNGYLGVVERRYGIPSSAHLPVPTQRAYIAASQEDTGTPGLGNTRVYVICPGLNDTPEANPGGGYNAAFTLVIGIDLLNRTGREEVFSQLAYYLEAVHECVLREGFKVFGTDALIDWTGEATDEGLPGMALTEGSGQALFSVYLNDVVTSNESLFDSPPPDPYAPLPAGPEIENVLIDIQGQPITQPFE